MNMKYCGFCGKHESEVNRLVAGPTTTICNECVELAIDVVTTDPAESGKLKEQLEAARLGQYPKHAHVRIAVAVDQSGKWAAYGHSDLNDEDAISNASELVEPSDVHYFVEATLEIPRPRTVIGAGKPAP